MESSPVVLVRQGQGEEQAEVLRALPPGFRFRPTDEELVLQYLRRKALGFPLPAAVVPDLPRLHSLDPWDILTPGESEGEKYFFALRPSAARRTAAASGWWKPEGRERAVVAVCRSGRSHLVGVKRALAFVPRAHRGKKGSSSSSSSPAPALTAGWVMHEYRLALPPHHKNGCYLAQSGSEEWVVCRVFRRDTRPSSLSRRHTPAGHATMPMPASPSTSSSSSLSSSTSSCVTSGGSGSSSDDDDLQEEASS
ncbi:NAC domain-containing protein 83 [Brachypodium distachyon]|uniref:NAC domain-containing protein n=1 Tax=Brachypodium distachyon TaxID=15368 RepID=I1I8Z8_BRADI|nr:NAC domain-containing protein 83 [Brachypodium distachyon]KQJ99156.1 hypothetical protein BRADI_3g41470v3 [Brachypodium distachyon]|eukprot:XP_010235343.1 NAC domain-containing protein 83 [Brachypodium distachyon]